MTASYDYSRSLQSLFGYGKPAHIRSGCTCQLCGMHAQSFDLWRHLSIEHVIPRQRGGAKGEFRRWIPPAWGAGLADEIDAMNTVTACMFCNAMTSRYADTPDMEELLRSCTSREECLARVSQAIADVLERKKQLVLQKLEVVRAAYERNEHLAPAVAAAVTDLAASTPASDISKEGPTEEADCNTTEFQDDDAGFAAWIAAHPDGFVVNTNIPPSEIFHYPMLHRSDCRFLPRDGRTTHLYIKVCSASISALEEWSRQQSHKELTRCQKCNP